MARWAVHFAHAERAELAILDVSGEGRVVAAAAEGKVSDDLLRVAPDDVASLEGLPTLHAAWRAVIEVSGEPLPDGDLWPRVGLWRCGGGACSDRVLRFARERGTTLLVAGVGKSGGELSDPLFRAAPWRTILLRPGGADGTRCERVLTPCAGGPHSRAALRLARRLCVTNQGTMQALYVEPALDDPEISGEVGEQILERILKKAGLDRESLAGGEITPRVVVSDRVADGIRGVVAEEPFDLVLIGASKVGTIRQKLFGTVPERLLRDGGRVAVAVIRDARPLAEVVRERAERWLDLRIPQLTREARVDLFEKLQDGSRWSFDFMTLICLSTAIAAFGLIQNSTAVVIGAMLVAPLMTPILGCGLALVQGNFPLFRTAARAIVQGFFCALVVGFLIGLAAAPMTGLTSELAARGGPSLIDMGVAFVSGVAASYCLARPKLGAALAGVAIAAALVPPIATVGISLSLGEAGVARGAALLFVTNVVAIVLGTAVNLFAAGVRGSRKPSPQSRPLWARRALLALVAVGLLLTLPLGSVIVAEMVEKKNRVLNRQLPQELRPGLELILGGGQPDLDRVSIDALRRLESEGGQMVLEIDLSAPTAPAPEQIREAAKAARDFFRKPVIVRVRTTLVSEAASGP